MTSLLCELGWVPISHSLIMHVVANGIFILTPFFPGY
jgi:hypothetical protein